MIFLAAIMFGSPGPIEHRIYKDATVSAIIEFRQASDRRDTGEEAPGPSIATGTLSIVVGGKRRSYDLTKVLPTREMRIVLPTTEGGCGTAEPMTRRGHYLAIETVIAQKGCTSSATFIDLDTGTVVEPVFAGEDKVWLRKERVKITRVEHVSLAILDYNRKPYKKVPWRFVIAHGRNDRGHMVSFSYDLDQQSFIPGAPPIPVPTKGQTISLRLVRERLDFASGRRDVNERTLTF